MTAPSFLTGRGRGVAKRRWYRWKPIRRPGAEALEEEAAWPEHVYTIPGARRAIPPGELDPARAAWIEKLLRDPAAAKRERLEARLAYWRARLAKLQERLAAAEQAVHDALNPPIDEDGPPPPVPAAIVWHLRAAAAAAWADVQAARAQVEALERELEQ